MMILHDSINIYTAFHLFLPTKPGRSMSEEDKDYRMFDAAVEVPLSSAVLLLIVPVLILEWKNKKPARHKDAKLTKHLMFALMSCNTVHQIIYIIKWLLCFHCGYLFGAVYISRVLVKGTNLLFLVHRAKLSQGMAPVLSKIWFERILPSMITGLVIMFIVLTTKSLVYMPFVCKPYDDWNSLHICAREEDESVNNDSDVRSTAALAIGVDLIITIFLMVLFVVPLYRVYRLDLGVMNANQIKQRRVLKNLLIWSLPLALINQLTSSLLLVHLVHSSTTTKTLYLIGQFDPPINIWTSWLMVTRNRKYLRRTRRCICSSKGRTPAPSLRRGSTVLMDIDIQEIINNVNRLASAKPVGSTETEMKQSTEMKLSSIVSQISDRTSEQEITKVPKVMISN